MRALLDAGLELRMIRHEIDAAHSNEISELQVAAEQDRRRQVEVWDKIKRLPSVADLLKEIDTQSKDTQYYQQYFQNYETVLYGMIQASLQRHTPNRPARHSRD